MDLASFVAWAMFAVLIGWLGWVLWATFRQFESESRDAAAERDRLNRP
jgi:hypothetical protein